MPDPSTTRLALYKSKSDGSELVNYPNDLGQNWDKVDAATGFQVVTSSTRPSTPYSGKPIAQSDTAYSTYFSNGTSPASASWVEIPNSSSTFASNLKLSTTSQLVIGVDTNLYRSAANVLKTDDSLIIGGDLKLVNGTTLYRNTLGPTSVTTVANTVTETVVATATIPAADAVAGAVYRLKAWGIASVTGTPTFTLGARLGGVAGASMGSLGPTTASTGVANKAWTAEFEVICVTAGASGTWMPRFAMFQNISVATVIGSNHQIQQTAAVTRDTTVSNAMVVTWTWGTASASNTATCQGFIFERVA